MIDKIVLIGYRATGKSTIGRELASRLNFSFLDTDSLVRQKSNSTIEEIVENQGWDAFRKCEAQALKECFGASKAVIATGGGAVLHRRVWEQYGKDCLVVWLTAELQVLAARLTASASGGAERPTLTGRAIDAEIEEVLTTRTPLYREFSDIDIDTGKMSLEQAVDSIYHKFHTIAAGV